MRLLIDADGCPVVDSAVRLAGRHRVECLILCDTAHRFERPGATTLTFDKGADSVDFALVNRVAAGDVVVTQDYGLAAMALARGARPLSQDGLVYTAGNIEGLLGQRHLNRVARRAGGRTKGPPKRTGAQDDAFERALEALLEGTEEENG